MNSKAAGLQPLSEAELEQLGGFLSAIQNEEALTLEGMDGLFCALIAGPDSVLPSEYLPLVWGGELPDANAFASLEDANATLGLMMRHWNSIIAEIERERVYVPLILDTDPSAVPGRPWARGFMRGVALRRAGWAGIFSDEREGQLLSIPLVAGEIDPGWPHEPLSAERREELVSWMAVGFMRAYRHFGRERQERARAQALNARRGSIKIGRNAPCPCESGRKYKHCCGAAAEHDEA
jgi:uncharacterized protein